MEKFQTHNDAPGIEVSGTSFMGAIDTSYAVLKAVFGNPRAGDGYKVSAEWVIRFSDGTVATIYDYKTSKKYCGKDGVSKKDDRDWHVGGFGDGERLVALVKAAIVS